MFVAIATVLVIASTVLVIASTVLVIASTYHGDGDNVLRIDGIVVAFTTCTCVHRQKSPQPALVLSATPLMFASYTQSSAPSYALLVPAPGAVECLAVVTVSTIL
jgi:hypothetical protein